MLNVCPQMRLNFFVSRPEYRDGVQIVLQWRSQSIFRATLGGSRGTQRPYCLFLSVWPSLLGQGFPPIRCARSWGLISFSVPASPVEGSWCSEFLGLWWQVACMSNLWQGALPFVTTIAVTVLVNPTVVGTTPPPRNTLLGVLCSC